MGYFCTRENFGNIIIIGLSGGHRPLPQSEFPIMLQKQSHPTHKLNKMEIETC